MEQLKFQFREIIKTVECGACGNIIEFEKSKKSAKCKCGIVFVLGNDGLVHARVENDMRYVPQIAVKYNSKNKCYEVYRSAKEKIDLYIEKDDLITTSIRELIRFVYPTAELFVFP